MGKTCSEPAIQQTPGTVQPVDVPATGSKNLSRVGAAGPDMEKLATEVVQTFNSYCAKLSALKPKIEKIQAWFKFVKGSETLAGCRSFKEFCQKKLNRTEQAVYAMLGEYSKKENRVARRHKKPQPATTHTKLVPADEDIERLRTGCNAAVRHFEAASHGNQAEAEKAKQEFLAISKVESLKSVISGDQPNYKAILIDLLSEIEKVGARLPVSLTQKSKAIRHRLGISDASFGLTPEDREPKIEQQPKAEEAKVLVSSAPAKAKKQNPEYGRPNRSGNGNLESQTQVVNGLNIMKRSTDSKFGVIDPAKTTSNTVAICDNREQAIAAAQRKGPEQLQSTPSHVVSA